MQPITEGYRNKDEFNIQTGVDGNPKTVGFFVGSPAEGSVVCVRGTRLINVRHSHIEVAQVRTLLPVVSLFTGSRERTQVFCYIAPYFGVNSLQCFEG